MIEDFLIFMASTGLQTRDRIIADGRLRRFHIEGDKPRSLNGWYVAFDDGLSKGVSVLLHRTPISLQAPCPRRIFVFTK